MRVLICDDDAQQSQQAANAINQLGVLGDQAVPLHSKDLTIELTSFFNNISGKEGPESLFEAGNYDCVLLDNNLSGLEIAGARLTAEAIAGYIRAHSGIPYIVSLNKNPDVDFDLRFLIGDYSTIADLALNIDHLENKALWTGGSESAYDAFNPWYWPNLLDEPERRRKQISFIMNNLDTAVFSALDIPSDVAHYISRHATGALSPNARYESIRDEMNSGVPIQEVTFRNVFLDRSRSLPDKKDREEIDSMTRSRSSGSAKAREIISRVVAADIDLWFRRDLLAPQDAVVDLPHLLLRMPFLLGDQAGEISAWNAVIDEVGSPFGLSPGTYDEFLAGDCAVMSIWSPRPAFYWPKLRDMQYRTHSSQDVKTTIADVVFCEDISKFIHRNSTGGPIPVPFKAEFEGSWTNRYVARVGDKKYAPRSRFAL